MSAPRSARADSQRSAARRRADASELWMMCRDAAEDMERTSPDAVPGHRDGRATRPFSDSNTDNGVQGVQKGFRGFRVQG